MDLSGYLLTVAGGAAFGIIADILTDAFSKSKRGTDKYINFGVTLCIASIMILPPLRLFGGGADIDFERYFTQGTESTHTTSDSLYILERECEEKLSEKLYTDLGIKVTDISIEIEMRDGTPYVLNAAIVLSPSEEEKKTTVLECARTALGPNAEITVTTDG